MKIWNIVFFLTALFAWMPSTPACATIVTRGFLASIESGTLAGTMFQGTVAYDNAGLLGVGVEYFPLTSIDFVLGGVQFDRADITQGGQMLTLNGVADYFTASFFPTPQGSPVSNITFGFGGPGVIGTYNIPDDIFGRGSFVLSAVSIPEPFTASVLGTALICLLVLFRRNKDVGRKMPSSVG